MKSYRAGWLLLAVGCASEPPYEELGIDCEGKCDGLSSIKALVSDIKDLDLNDLIVTGASFATEQLDVKLGNTTFAQVQLRPTELYAPEAVAAQDLTLNDLDRLVVGLATQFGESALATEVNAIRAEHLATSGKRVYAESAFRIEAGHGWELPANGLTGSARLGFSGSIALEARVITAHARESTALVQGPLAATKAARGFVLPRSIGDIRAMEPGESFALSGKGNLGVNLGVGVPILIANPVSALTYSLVVSAGMRSVFDGQLDVQLVRMRDNEVVIDVGVQTATVKQAKVALEDGFGVQGLVASKVEIAGAEVDLGKLLDKALNKRVGSKLDLISAAAERTKKTMRMSVARMRFDLAGPDPIGGREAALAQALRGDLRLAQALAARGDSGVHAEFDLVRSGASAISYAGVDVVGMSFYRTRAATEGAAVLQTPGGVLALMWESLHREAGWFFSSHGFTRVGVAGLRFDARDAGVVEGETNLILQTQEGDKFMERDKVIDQLDSVIVAAAGFEALRAIERKGNELERLILARCPLPASGDFFDEDCNINLIRGDSQVAALRTEALADLDRATANLPGDIRDLVHQAGDLRLAAQSIEDPNASAVGPTASVVFNFRLDDTALRGVFSKERAVLEERVLDLMAATQLDRKSTSTDSNRTAIRQRSAATAKAMADAFDAHRNTYGRLLSIDGARIARLGEIGSLALEVRYTVDGSKRPVYEQAVSQSIAQARAETASSLFDALRAAAKSMPGSGGSRAPHAEQLAAFALLAMAPVRNTELRFDLRTDNGSCALCGSRERYDVAGFTSVDLFARGPEASPIAAGLFDIDAIIEAPKP